MGEVLSQSEIDALLAAVSTGEVETKETVSADASEDMGDWVAYDLTSQEKIVKNRYVALQGIHERFARHMRMSLTNQFKKNVSVNVSNIDYIRYGEYVANILLPTSINVLTMSNLKGHMLLIVSSKLAYALMDAYYGGIERPFTKVGGRDEFTTIENNMISKIIEIATLDLKQAWKLNYPIELEFLRADSNPNFVGCIHASEHVAVVNIDIEFENLSGPLVIIVQLKALESIHSALSIEVVGDTSFDYSAWSEHWRQQILDIPLDVRVELGGAARKLRDVSLWNPGDVLLLEQDSVAPLEVRVEGLLKLKGVMGNFRGNHAVRVTELKLPTKEK